MIASSRILSVKSRFLTLILIFVCLIPFNKINSSEDINNFRSKERSSEKNKVLKSEYLLDTGDSVFIEFIGLNVFSRNYSVDPDGYIDLPEINKLYVRNLSIEELKAELTRIYKEFIIDPGFKISISSYRPINIYISGEVNSPGLYQMKYQQIQNIPQENRNEDIFNPQDPQNLTLVPKIYNALQIANGLTTNADLSNIEIIRKNSNSQGGGKIKAEVNLLELLLKGDQSQNIRLYDGDYINVNKSTNIIKEQVLAINKTNLNPDTVTVYISGNISEPGEKNLKRGVSLIQAIATAGGKNIMSGKIEFIRFQSDGSIYKTNFKYNNDAKLNSKKNPVLMDGDIIFVRKTILQNASDVMLGISSPILTGIGFYNLFN